MVIARLEDVRQPQPYTLREEGGIKTTCSIFSATSLLLLGAELRILRPQNESPPTESDPLCTSLFSELSTRVVRFGPTTVPVCTITRS